VAAATQPLRPLHAPAEARVSDDKQNACGKQTVKRTSPSRNVPTFVLQRGPNNNVQPIFSNFRAEIQETESRSEVTVNNC